MSLFSGCSNQEMQSSNSSLINKNDLDISLLSYHYDLTYTANL